MRDRSVPPSFVPVERLSRRGWFATTAGILTAGCSKAARWETRPVPVGQDVAEIMVADYPQLGSAGGMIAVRPQGTRDTVLVMRIEHDQYRVMDLRCPHLGCTVRWDNEDQALVCPCHGSRFADDGRVLEGPAKRGLAVLPYQLQGTMLQFRLPKKKK